jgi:glycosyltransferase involved in cell wall biosynthesis
MIANKSKKNLPKNVLVSVVIPAYNEEENIEKCIKSLLNQTHKNLEVIIVDDGSEDETRKIIQNFSKVTLIEGEHKGPGISRNLGAKKAKGEILVFVDADMVFDKDYIKYLIAPVIEGTCIGTEEKFQEPLNPENKWSRCWGQYVGNDRFEKNEKGFVFRSILKDSFFELGGFDPKYGYADDLTFNFKYNLKPDFADKAICYHKNPSTLKEVFSQSKWIGASIYGNNKIFRKKLYFPLVFVMGTLSLIPFGSYVFSKRLISKKYKLRTISDIFNLAIFSSVRAYGSLIGVLRRSLFGINYR